MCGCGTCALHDWRQIILIFIYFFIDFLPKFVIAYNDKVHTPTGMASTLVTDSDVIAILLKKDAKRRRCIRVAKVKFSVGQRVSINKDKMKLPSAVSKISPPKYFECLKRYISALDLSMNCRI